MPAFPTSALAVLVAVLVAACGGAAPAAGPAGRPPALVSAVEASSRDVPVYVDAIGKAVASEVVTIRARVSGTLASVEAPDGGDVDVKAALFTIDPIPFQARLAEAKAREAASAASLVEATAAVESARSRIESARSRVVEAEAQLVAAKATAEEVGADVASAEADAARAETDARRFEEAAKGGAVSSIDLDRMRADARTAQARLSAVRRREAAARALVAQGEASGRTANAAVAEAVSGLAEAQARVVAAQAAGEQSAAMTASAQLDMDWTKIRSPIRGRTGRRLVDAGNVVMADTTPLLMIQTTDPIHAEFSVTESEFSLVRAHLGGTPLQAEVSIPGEADSARTGDLVFVDAAVAEATGTVRLRAQLANADGRFWPGRFVRVRLVLATKAAAILIPAGAPQQGPAGAAVYVVVPAKDPAPGAPPTAVELRSIVLGQRQGEFVVVEKGLAAGERVVTAGQMTLFPGAPVVVAPPPPAAGEPAAGMGSGASR